MRTVFVFLAIAILLAVFVLNRAPEQPVPAESSMPAMEPAAADQRSDNETDSNNDLPVADEQQITETQPGDEKPQVREVVIDQGADFMMAMKSLGIDNIEERLASWYKSRGYPFSDQTGTYLLEQPYQEYDDETLRAFAENDDIWAQQFLAERLAKTRPAEALELYQRAAANGSVNAMHQIMMLYNRIDLMRADSPNLDDTHREQLYALKDSGNSASEMSYAWAIASELAGGDPFLGNQRAGMLADRLTDDQKSRGCDMAQALYDQMVSDRSTRGLGDFDRQPPPFMMGSLDALSKPSCANLQGHQALNFSGCEDVRAIIGGQSNELVVCRSGGE